MVNTIDLAKLTVKVAGGSGCLFQPSDEGYSYILTARHVVEGQPMEKIDCIHIENATEAKIPVKFKSGPFFHPDETKDAAIIKIERVDWIDGLLRATDLTIKTDTYLAGHPAVRNAKDYTFRKDPLTIMNQVGNGYFEGQFSNNVNLEEIKGQSGGGIFQVDNGSVLLAGIQHGMAMTDENESLNRHEFMPLSFFDEIVQAEPDELSPIFPPYIQCFDHLLGEIFDLHGFQIPKQKEMIQKQLRFIAKSLGDGFSPEQILNGEGSALLINGTPESMLHHRQLWVAFLEMLSISQLHSDEKLDMSQLPELYKKRKLYFADTKEWSEKLEDIYRSDLSAIEKGGCIVVAASQDLRPTIPVMHSAIIENISTVPFGEMNISSTVKNPIKDLRIVHIFAFQQRIIENVLAYTNINVNTTQEILRDETKGII